MLRAPCIPCRETQAKLLRTLTATAIGVAVSLSAGTALAQRAPKSSEPRLAATQQLGLQQIPKPEPKRARRNAVRDQTIAWAPRLPRPQIAAAPPEPLLAVISLDHQRISVHGGSGPVLESAISSGQSGYRTPTGVFSILQRNRHHASNIYSGASMPFMQRLTWSGIALHEGVVPGYPASHGCVRLPVGIASQLWTLGRVGMRVVVAASDVRPEPIAHPSLPVPQQTVVAHDTTPYLIRIAATGTDTGARQLDPFQRAQSAKLRAANDREAAERAVRPALVDAIAKSAEAARATEHVRLLAGQMLQAEADLADKHAALALNQTLLDDSDTVRAANASRERYDQLEQEHTAAKAIEAKISDAAFAAARTANEAERAIAEAAQAQQIASYSSEPVSIFVSRKEGRVFVRQGFMPIHDEPISIVGADQPFGNHIFTAMAAQDEGRTLRWTSVTIPETTGHEDPAGAASRSKRREARDPPSALPASSAAAVLDRFELPDATLQVIRDRLWPGASIIVSDRGLSPETGIGTDFIVLTK